MTISVIGSIPWNLIMRKFSRGLAFNPEAFWKSERGRVSLCFMPPAIPSSRWEGSTFMNMREDTTVPSLPVHADIGWWEKEFKALVSLQGNATGAGMAKYLQTCLTGCKARVLKCGLATVYQAPNENPTLNFFDGFTFNMDNIGTCIFTRKRKLKLEFKQKKLQ